MSYVNPTEFVAKMIDAGEAKVFMSTRDTVIRAYMAGAILTYRNGGVAALRAKPVPGRPPKLTRVQMRMLFTMISGSNPAQYQLDFALWTRDLVRQVIARRHPAGAPVPPGPQHPTAPRDRAGQLARNQVRFGPRQVPTIPIIGSSSRHTARAWSITRRRGRGPTRVAQPPRTDISTVDSTSDCGAATATTTPRPIRSTPAAPAR